MPIKKQYCSDKYIIFKWEQPFFYWQLINYFYFILDVSTHSIGTDQNSTE